MTREEWCEEGKKVVRELRGFQQELDHVQRVQHPWLVGKPLTEEEISAFATQQNVAYPWEKESCPSPEAKRKSGGRLKGISQILATPMTWLKRKLIER